MTAGPAAAVPSDTFCHEAFFYAGLDDFLDVTAAFVRDGVANGEPVLVVVDKPKIAALRDELGPDAGAVEFADMAQVGINPARILPVWRQFVHEQGGGGRRLRGVGEPVWAGRTDDELAECRVHETLLNVAFADGQAWWLLCPYDASALGPSVLTAARASHAAVRQMGSRAGGAYRRVTAGPALLGDDLPPPPPGTPVLAFTTDDLSLVRQTVDRFATTCDLDAVRAADLVLCVNELATNSLRHGGGRGELRMWCDLDRVTCEVRDAGTVADPLAGRHLPAAEANGGRGLWLVNQLCDLVQMRAVTGGTVVRVHIGRSGGTEGP